MSLITDSVGRVLGQRYRLVSALGTGASAHVFLAEDVTLQRHVAVKVLQPGLSRDHAFLKRFGAEARSAASLNHPHVLGVFDWGEDDGPYLVLEYLAGGSLRDLLDRRVRLTQAQAARLGREVAEGLAYAHGRGLVHRDVKPANLLFDEEGRVRVADFGVARALAEAAWTEPPGAMIGTARYASPEQAEGRPVDGRSDVYSLALVLYETLSGMVPFAADTTVATLMARVGAPLPSHPSLGPLAPVLGAAADWDRERRLDAATLASELAAIGAALPEPEALAVGRRHQAPPADASGARNRGGGARRVRAGPGEVFDVEALDAGTGDTGVLDAGSPDAWPTAEVVGADGPGSRTAVMERSPTVVGAAPAPASPSGPAGGGRVRSRRRRWRWPVAVTIVLALVAAGAGYAVQTRLFTPSRRVPGLAGLNITAARHALAARHLDLSEGRAVYSITRAAGTVVSQAPGRGTLRKEGTSVRVIPSKGPPPVSVPSLAQVDCPTAQRLLDASHLQGTCPPGAEAYSATVADNQVIDWEFGGKVDPAVAPYGSSVVIAISKGPAPVTIADLSGSGTTYATASAALHQSGLGASESEQYSTSVPQGQVIGTDPAAGITVPHGSVVAVIVSEGPPPVDVPNVLGDAAGPAGAALQADGLVVGQVYGPGRGLVFATDPAVGTSVPVGTTVNLYTR